MKDVQISAIHYQYSFTRPGESARWTVVVSNTSKSEVSGELSCQISDSEKTLYRLSQKVTLKPGEQSFDFEWLPPAKAPRGYGLDVAVDFADSSRSAVVSSGFDVLDKWTQMPRYGFLTDFFPERKDSASMMQQMADLHINGLQFYDWMYRHEQFFTNDEPYIDILDRTLSLNTVKELIADAHKHGIAAMPYTAIYGVSVEFFNSHKDWGMYHADGSPVYLGENFMAYVDPRPGRPWTVHMLNEFKGILQKTDFDGIHLDQYGDPKVGYDAKGDYFDLGQAIADTITDTHKVVDEYRKDGAVVFNCVTNWPVELASRADEDIIYIEVWDPYTNFSDLHNLVTYAQSQNTGKPVVLAAYVHPANSANPMLMDAIIFGSGGGRIELGENFGYLVEAYFPKYEIPTEEQRALLQNYYDFAVRYQTLIGPATTEATGKWINNIKVGGLKVGLSEGSDVFALARETDQTLAISLVNLTGINSFKWNVPVHDPTPAKDLTFTLKGLDKAVKEVVFTSPDGEDFSLQKVEFSQKDGELTVKIPALRYWDLLVLRY